MQRVAADCSVVTIYFNPSETLRNAFFSSLVRCQLQLTCTNRNLFCVHSFRPYLAFAKLVDSDISLEFYYPQSTPCKHPVIVLQDVAFTDLHALVEFIYHGEVNVHQRSLSSFLKTAEVLRVSGLTQQQAEETHNVSEFKLPAEAISLTPKIISAVSSSTKYGSIWRQNAIESSSELHWQAGRRGFVPTRRISATPSE